MSGNSICFNKKNGFPMQLISKQQTGKKMISSDTFKIPVCAVFVHAQLQIWYMLIRQVAALRHVKN